MSHESLASLWSTLTDYEDLGVCLRDAAGRYALSASSNRQDPSASTDILVTYATELSAIFDFVRTSNNTVARSAGLKQIKIHQDQILSALANLLCNVGLQNIIDPSQTQRTAFSFQILARVILSATCALKSLSDDQQAENTGFVAVAAHDLLLQIPNSGNGCPLLQSLCQYVIGTWSSGSSQGQNQNSEISWNNIHNSVRASINIQSRELTLGKFGEERETLVDQIIQHATDPSSSSENRIRAVIEICHAYWETEAFLIRSCMTVQNGQAEQNFEDTALEATKMMETRHLIQDYLTAADTDVFTNTQVQEFHLHLLFMPGLTSSCVLDRCQCAFKQRQANLILDMRKAQPRLLRSSLQKSFRMSPLMLCSTGFLDSIYTDFQNRLENSYRSRRSHCHPAESALKVDNLSTPVSLPSQQHVSPSTLEQSQGNLATFPEPRLSSQPTLSRRFSRPRLPSNRSGYYPKIDETAETEDAVAEDSMPRSPATSESGYRPLEQPSRNNSMTTMTSSSNAEDQSKISTAIVPATTREREQESYKIAVETPKTMVAGSPWDFEKSLPEVAIHHRDPDSLSMMSEHSVPMTTLSIKQPSSRSKWSNLLRSKKGVSPVFILPKFRFFASGKHILFWTKNGAGYIDPSKKEGHEFTPIYIPDIVHAAGGTKVFALISRLREAYRVSVYRVGESNRFAEWDLPKSPCAIDLSRDDKHLAFKYTPLLRLYSLDGTGLFVTHKLPTHDNSKPGSGNHVVSFSHDSQSFMASTRFQPERVYTYWSICTQSATSRPTFASSSAPSGHVDDHGLTALAVCGATARNFPSAFLSTFTEKGSPVILTMGPGVPATKFLRDPRDQIGARIHGAAMNVDANSKSNLVLVNHNNTVFWVTDIFGRDTKVDKVCTLKRPKSLKNEVQVAMSNSDEASIFWIDKDAQVGVLMKVGKNGGETQPRHFRLDVDPLCGG